MLRVYFFSPFCLSIINTVFIGSWFRCEIWWRHHYSSRKGPRKTCQRKVWNWFLHNG
jgi:hypothetical protein